MNAAYASAQKAQAIARVDAALKAGQITEAYATELKTQINAATFPGFGAGPGGGHHGHGGPGGRGSRPRASARRRARARRPRAAARRPRRRPPRSSSRSAETRSTRNGEGRCGAPHRVRRRLALPAGEGRVGRLERVTQVGAVDDEAAAAEPLEHRADRERAGRAELRQRPGRPGVCRRLRSQASPARAAPRPRDSRATRAGATGRRRSRRRRRRRARSRACRRRSGRRRGQVHERRTDFPGGISGSSQSTVITCSSWSDCSRPAAAASKSVRPRGEPITAAHTRGGTGAAARLTRVLGAARADHERGDLARDDPDAVDVARAREDPAPLGARRGLVRDDRGRDPAGPRPTADAVVVAGRRRSGVPR